MGATAPPQPNDYSDTPMGETISFTLDGNLYWNGGSALPYDAGELINITDDVYTVAADTLLLDSGSIVLPR